MCLFTRCRHRHATPVAQIWAFGQSAQYGLMATNATQVPPGDFLAAMCAGVTPRRRYHPRGKGGHFCAAPSRPQLHLGWRRPRCCRPQRRCRDRAILNPLHQACRPLPVTHSVPARPQRRVAEGWIHRVHSDTFHWPVGLQAYHSCFEMGP